VSPHAPIRMPRPPSTFGTVKCQSASSVKVPCAPTGFGRAIVADVVLRLYAASVTGCCGCPKRKRGGGVRFTACPSTVRPVTTIPSVMLGTGPVRAALAAYRFWSSRSSIARIALSLGFSTTTRSWPVTRPVAGSSFAVIV